jgi:hypothetical protein
VNYFTQGFYKVVSSPENPNLQNLSKGFTDVNSLLQLHFFFKKKVKLLLQWWFNQVENSEKPRKFYMSNIYATKILESTWDIV